MKRSQTAYVILGILSVHPGQSGYHIRKTIECSVGYFWGESYGQIYPTLKRLVAEGLIAPDNSSSTSKRCSQEYFLTPAGHVCLQQWLAVPYREDPPRDEFLLKLFFGHEAPPTVTIAHVKEFQARNNRLLTAVLELEAASRSQNGDDPRFQFWMLTLTYGLGQIRSALLWSESALALLSTIEPNTLPDSHPADTLVASIRTTQGPVGGPQPARSEE